MTTNTDTNESPIETNDAYIIETRTPPPKNTAFYMKRIAKMAWEIISWGVIVTFLWFVCFIGDFNVVSGISMDTTLNDGMRVIAIKSFFDPQRGDIITTKPQQTPDMKIIKRVIAVEGDELLITGSQVYLNGERLHEPYIYEPMKPAPERIVTIPKGHVWVMGDNRNYSADSRHFGAVSVDDIIGKGIYFYNSQLD